VAPGTVCASACAIAWLGGARRHLDPSSSVGFHAAYIDENGRQIESGVANALVGSYANRLGLTDNAIIFITSAGPREMNWVQTGSNNANGIAFSTDSAQYVVSSQRSFMVQIHHSQTDEEARANFTSLQNRFINILGGITPTIQRFYLDGGRTIFRTRIGPYSAEAAAQKCQNLISAGGQCFVVAN
jgi:hypothetical protein